MQRAFARKRAPERSPNRGRGSDGRRDVAVTELTCYYTPHASAPAPTRARLRIEQLHSPLGYANIAIPPADPSSEPSKTANRGLHPLPNRPPETQPKLRRHGCGCGRGKIDRSRDPDYNLPLKSTASPAAATAPLLNQQYARSPAALVRQEHTIHGSRRHTPRRHRRPQCGSATGQHVDRRGFGRPLARDNPVQAEPDKQGFHAVVPLFKRRRGAKRGLRPARRTGAGRSGRSRT